MKKPPTLRELAQVVQAIMAKAKPLPTDRASFVATALLLQRFEGVEPGITITLPKKMLNAEEGWVEFKPFHRPYEVRRLLSPETTKHLQLLPIYRDAKSGDQIFQWLPGSRVEKISPEQRGLSKRYQTWNEAVHNEVRRAGFDPKKFDPILLKWGWLDEHLGIREEEVRVSILAAFVLKHAGAHQREGQLRLLFNHTSVPRPSWALPPYSDSVANVKPEEACVG